MVAPIAPVVVGAVAGAAATTVIAPVVLGGLGFTAGGVAASSMAAAWQASIGNVVAHSLFAVLQSVGAAGMGAIGVAITSLGGAAVGGVTGLVLLLL
ncbi:UNVERIFIED_CONTAM: hypothetical protein RMT77_011728 [Armadillidium vulgare]